jgi:hypothetical protein
MWGMWGHAQYVTVGPKLGNCRVTHAGRAAECDRDAMPTRRWPPFPVGAPPAS